VDLGPVGGVGEAAGAEAVPQRQGDVVLLDDGQKLVKVLIEGIFPVVVAHPLDGEGPAPGDHVHQSPLVLHPFHGGASDAAVDGDEVHSILGMLDDAGKDVVHGHVDDGLFLHPYGVDRRLVEGDRADAGVGFGDDGATNLVHRAPGGEIHDGVGAMMDRDPRLFQLLGDVQVIGGGADVGVHLGAESGADGQGHAVGVLEVVADDDGAVGNAGADEVRLHPFGGGCGPHLVGNDPLAGKVQLGNGHGDIYSLRSIQGYCCVPGSLSRALNSRVAR
jgi:hypothetical protein